MVIACKIIDSIGRGETHTNIQLLDLPTNRDDYKHCSYCNTFNNWIKVFIKIPSR